MNDKHAFTALIGTAIAIAFTAVAMVVNDQIIETRTRLQLEECRENLRLIVNAKQALIYRQPSPPEGSIAIEDLIRPQDTASGFLEEAPICPNGGAYLPGRGDEEPRCGKHGNRREANALIRGT